MIIYPQLQIKAWLEKEIQNKSLHQVAREIGCSYGAVSNRVRYFNIKVPIRKNKLTKERVELLKMYWKKRFPNGRFGKDAARWKGGRRLCMGYWIIYKPKHPYATKQGYVMEHRLVMENKLGRYLKPEELVHHVNHVKTDNRPENLEIYNRSDHVHNHFDYGNKLVAEIERLKKILEEHKIKY